MTTVSYSEISQARQCLHAHHLGYVLRLRSSKESRALTLGTNWHSILEAHYKAIGAEYDPAYDVGQAFELLRSEGLNREDDELLSWMYSGYVELYGFDPQWKVLGVEHRFDLELPPSANSDEVFRIKGMIDLVVTDPKGRMWVIDHKSGARGPQEKALDLSDQFAIYGWAMEQAGYEVWGTIHSWANTKMNVHWEKQTLESRFKRTPIARTKKEMKIVAGGLADSAGIAYGDHNHPKSPSEDNCQYRCDYVDACLHGRRGGDELQFLEATGFTYTERH